MYMCKFNETLDMKRYDMNIEKQQVQSINKIIDESSKRKKLTVRISNATNNNNIMFQRTKEKKKKIRRIPFIYDWNVNIVESL